MCPMSQILDSLKVVYVPTLFLFCHLVSILGMRPYLIPLAELAPAPELCYPKCPTQEVAPVASVLTDKCLLTVAGELPRSDGPFLHIVQVLELYVSFALS